VNTVTHTYDTSAALPGFLLAKDRQNSGRCFQACILTFANSCANFMSNLWLDRKFEASALTLFDIRL